VRNVTWNGHWVRSTERGSQVEHTSSLTIAIDTTSGCRKTNGTASTTVDSRGVDTRVTDYQVCRVEGADKCPSGSVTYTSKQTGRSVSATFDGSAQAKVTGPNGNSITVPLVCGT
jgi:hypothetical protein